MKLAATIAFLSSLVALAPAQAVSLSGDPGFNADSPYNKLYNYRTVINFKGKIKGMEVAPPMSGMGNAVSLIVKSTSGTTWHVDVGPEWYVNNQQVHLKVDDEIQVTGSRVSIDGKDVILAEQIVKKKSVLALRRPAGRPYWDAVYTQAPGGTAQRVVTGTISKVDTFVDGTNGPTEEITIHTDEGDVVVALAPDWFMKRQAAQLYLGNFVNVNAFAPAGVPTQPVGSNLVAPPVIFATSVNFGNQWMVLRSNNGTPMWYGIGGN